MGWAIRMGDRISALLGAVGMSQFPAFFQQYRQRLAGHIEELQLKITKLQELATESGLDLQEYIAKFASSQDATIASQGEFLQGMQERLLHLQAAQARLAETSAYWKPFSFLGNLDLSVAKGTLADFTPGMSFSLEGLVYALIGLVLGVALFSLLMRLFSFRSRKQKA